MRKDFRVLKATKISTCELKFDRKSLVHIQFNPFFCGKIPQMYYYQVPMQVYELSLDNTKNIIIPNNCLILTLVAMTIPSNDQNRKPKFNVIEQLRFNQYQILHGLLKSRAAARDQNRWVKFFTIPPSLSTKLTHKTYF